jgi:hypothetical protein
MLQLARRAASATLVIGLALTPVVTSASSLASGLQPLRIALDWTPNVDFLGIYVAINKGYFTREGIRPVIIPYSGTPGETLIEAGKTDLAFTYPPSIPAYRASGLKYRAVAGLAQKNTIELAVLQSSAYTSPAQLTGKLYGGFGVPSDEPIIDAIFKKVGVAHPVFRQVVLNTSAYQALEAKRVAYTTMFGGVDDVTAELGGAKLRPVPDPQLPGVGGQFSRRFVGGEQQRDRHQRVGPAPGTGGIGSGLHLFGPPPGPSRRNLDRGQPFLPGDQPECRDGHRERHGAHISHPVGPVGHFVRRQFQRDHPDHGPGRPLRRKGASAGF